MFDQDHEIDTDSLWIAISNGDQDAFARLVERHYARLFSYGSKLERDPEQVKDCIQDVWVEIWTRRERLTKPNSILAYLLKSLRRRIARERQASRSLLFDSFDDQLPFDVEFSIETQLVAEQTQLDHVRRLTYLLSQLPKRQKEVVYLRYYQKLDYPDIAELMGLSRQTVYNHMNDAIGKLRQYWHKPTLLLVLMLLR